MSTAFIGIGSNLGKRLDNCRMAIERLKEGGIGILKASSFYETEPYGYRDQPWFINCVIKAETQLDPLELFTLLQKIEGAIGRKRDKNKWGPRIIDLDLLFYDNLIIEDDRLILPHPLSHLRGFVLVPLKEIEPDFIHPLLKKTIAELAGGLKDKKKVSPIDIL